MNSRIAVGGERRLREAIVAEVRKEFEKELAAAAHDARAAIKEKINRVIKERMKEVSSPQSLWLRSSLG